MPKIEMRDLVSEYYNTIKDELPKEMTYEDFENVCKSPWKFFLRQMERPDTPLIQIKYLGKLKVFSESVLKKIKSVELQYKLGHIGVGRYKEKRKFYTDILERVVNEEKGNAEIEVIDDYT